MRADHPLPGKETLTICGGALKIWSNFVWNVENIRGADSEEVEMGIKATLLSQWEAGGPHHDELEQKFSSQVGSEWRA